MNKKRPQPISTLLLQRQHPEAARLAQTGDYRVAVGCTGKKQKTIPPTLVDNDGVEFSSPHQT